MALRLPKNTELNYQGEPRGVAIMSDGEEYSASVAYGLLVSTDDETKGVIKGSRYVLSMTTTSLGKETTRNGVGVDLLKAFDALCDAMGLDPEEVELHYDEDDEFFSQKYAAPKASSSDVWNNPKFADNREELEAARAEVMDGINAAQASGVATQEEWRALAQKLVHVSNLLNNDTAALKSWAEGAGGDGDNSFSLINALGKGVNAVREAMRLAQISDLEYSVTPGSITSGKALDGHARNGFKELVDNAKAHAVYKDLDTSGDHADIWGAELLVRKVMAEGMGVPAAMERDDDGAWLTPLPNAVAAADAEIATWIADYQTKFGKKANMYVPEQASEARLAYGLARSSTKGGGVLAHAVSVIEAYHELDDDDAEGKKKLMSKLFAKTSGNALVKAAYDAAKSHAATVAKEDANRKAADAASKVDDAQVVSDAKSWADLPPEVAAAVLCRRMLAHSKPEQVEAALKSMLAQGVAAAAAKTDKAAA